MLNDKEIIRIFKNIPKLFKRKKLPVEIDPRHNLGGKRSDHGKGIDILNSRQDMANRIYLGKSVIGSGRPPTSGETTLDKRKLLEQYELEYLKKVSVKKE